MHRNIFPAGAAVVGIAEGRAPFQVFNRLEYQVEATANRVVFAVHARTQVIHLCNRVDRLIIEAFEGFVIISGFVVIDGEQRVSGQGATHVVPIEVSGSHTQTRAACVTGGQGFTEGKYVAVAVADNVVFRVQPQGVAFIHLFYLRLFQTDDRLLRGVGETKRESRNITAAGHIHGVSHLRGVLESHFFQPVGPFESTVVDAFQNAFRDTVGEILAVIAGFVQDFQILLGVERSGCFGQILEADVAVVLDRGFSLFPLFGRNQDYTVGGAGSVDGGRSGVFQYIDRLDVRGVQHADVAVGYTIYNIKRCRVADCSETTNRHLESFARFTALFGNVHTGSLALQGSEGIHCVQLGDVVAFDLHGSACDQFLLLYTVTDSHKLIEHVDGFLQFDV